MSDAIYHIGDRFHVVCDNIPFKCILARFDHKSINFIDLRSGNRMFLMSKDLPGNSGFTMEELMSFKQAYTKTLQIKRYAKFKSRLD